MANGEATALTPVGARQVVAEQADDDGREAAVAK
jgi:hypothetical protein